MNRVRPMKTVYSVKKSLAKVRFGTHKCLEYLFVGCVCIFMTLLPCTHNTDLPIGLIVLNFDLWHNNFVTEFLLTAKRLRIILMN